MAAASLASVGPYDAEGLDWLGGMGEQNVEEFAKLLEGEDVQRASTEKLRDEMLSSSPEQLIEVLRPLLGPSDREVATESSPPSCSTTCAPASVPAWTVG